MGLITRISAPGQVLAEANALARRIAGNAPLSNFAITRALPQIHASGVEEGLMFEAAIAALASSDTEAKPRIPVSTQLNLLSSCC